MATITDVYNALMDLAKDAAYPDGRDQPSIVGVPVNVVSGWPNAQRLETAIAGENVVVSVYKVTNMERDVPEFFSHWQTISDDGTIGTAIREVGRQEAGFWIIIWAKDAEQREIVANAINVAGRVALRLSLPYGETARIKYHHRSDDDKSQKVNVYRSTLVFSIEFATTEIKKFDVITNVTINSTYS